MRRPMLSIVLAMMFGMALSQLPFVIEAGASASNTISLSPEDQQRWTEPIGLAYKQGGRQEDLSRGESHLTSAQLGRHSLK